MVKPSTQIEIPLNRRDLVELSATTICPSLECSAATAAVAPLKGLLEESSLYCTFSLRRFSAMYLPKSLTLSGSFSRILLILAAAADCAPHPIPDGTSSSFFLLSISTFFSFTLTSSAILQNIQTANAPAI
ncbi:hypothetical protein KC19_8G168000 [Ceratodon purpureus]|uniref:Uncharacterized protein n=1 Tax=Ceratodon purpureus TaxID=3225 RepID=A0A8T0H444_CERPU|nr:hypothetical protein KC19_8G168000 [Ceratodon purpureus]